MKRVILIVALIAGGLWAEEPRTEAPVALNHNLACKQLQERWERANAEMATPVENLVLPVEFHPNGRVKIVLRAKQSQMFKDGYIFATGVHFDMFDVDGKKNGEMVMDDCLFDRERRIGYCKGRVHVNRDGDALKSRGMYFSTEPNFIKLLSECEIRTRRIPVDLGRLS